MLAVNGDIEASRSNNSGFNLVANDIRKLAQEASENAEQMRELIETTKDNFSRPIFSFRISKRVPSPKCTESRNHQNFQKIQVLLEAVFDFVEEMMESTEKSLSTLSRSKPLWKNLKPMCRESLKTLSLQVKRAEQIRSLKDLTISINEVANLADQLGQGSQDG